MKSHPISHLIKSIALAILLVPMLATAVTGQSKKSKEEWKTLFNGKDINDWIVKIHHHDVDVNFGNTFRVEDGIIKVRYDQYGDFNEQFGHLYYKQPYSYYRLVMDYRFVGELQRGAPEYTIKNSGVMFHSQDPRSMPKEQNWPISVEMQFLAGLGDGKPRPTCNMCSPGTDVVYNGKVDPNHCINSTSATYEGDQWVHTELIVMGDSLVIHKVNGEEVLRYSKPQMGGGVVTGYDPALWEPGKPLTEGYIALQSEGQPIDFKNIELLNLEGCMDPKATNYKSYFIKSKPDACTYKK
ncbi:DUF1080 domain-containing protein [uncultured Imperialibacter sp.]|uniref:3-keto-disaccharide hydrolase n=1 Tax=uncultured Imperialibacter sp. TaxID=1672639 RepID=UPI0030DCAB7A|tara:strand:+ start:3874 stop:4764 length:891 start_codon:yes stop_codon:yes gene_type:complete